LTQQSSQWAKGGLQELLDKAGSSTKAPPPPKQGIPKQRVPSWIRWPLKVLFLPFILLDSSVQKLAKKIIRPPYEKAGACLKRGNCCHYLLMEKPRGVLGAIHYFWNTEINGFYLRDEEPVEAEGKQMVVLGCRYLNKDNTCQQYAFRPKICRDWPLIEHFGRPQMLKGCGYQVKKRP
jgi:Fe-S-cluster containining protein